MDTEDIKRKLTALIKPKLDHSFTVVPGSSLYVDSTGNRSVILPEKSVHNYAIDPAIIYTLVIKLNVLSFNARDMQYLKDTVGLTKLQGNALEKGYILDRDVILNTLNGGSIHIRIIPIEVGIVEHKTQVDINITFIIAKPITQQVYV